MAGRKGESGDTPDTVSTGEGFLGRWSRRKADAKTADDIAAVDSELLPEDETSEGPPATRGADEPSEFDVSTLPDIDGLGPGSDFSMFMQAGVPQALKTKALRKLWRVKPELANLDGLLDYGEDLTGSFKVVDHLKTAYQVGRGFLKDQAEKAPDDGEVPGDGDAPDGVETVEGDAPVADAKPLQSLEPRSVAGTADEPDIARVANEPTRKS